MSELSRILALPVLTEPPAGSEILDELAGGSLRPIQRQALAEAMLCQGLVAPIAVGGGKTLVTLLLPNFLLSERPLLVVPAKLREKTRRDRDEYQRQGWWVSNPKIISYELLGRRDDCIYDYNPDLVMCDEAHRLKNKKAACTRKMARWLSKHQNVPFVALSGTFLSRTFMDFVHLFAWALKEKSPLPLSWIEAMEWSQALDDTENTMLYEWRPGPLEVFGSSQTEIRGNVHRRIVSAPGVVASVGSEHECTASITIDAFNFQLDHEQKKVLKEVQNTWELPSGEILTQAVDVWRHCRNITQGFYYRWDPEPPREWLEARREWKKFVRDTLKHSRTLDSEAQVAEKFNNSILYQKWVAIRGTYTPNVVPVTITDHVARLAAKWAMENSGIVWVDTKWVGELLSNTGVPYYGEQGLCDGNPIEDAEGGICASIQANAEGRNLQNWNKMLVLSPPSRGSIWEQLLGRLHRSGQTADSIEVLVNMKGSNEDAFRQALQDAKYQQQLFGKPQKILLADVVFPVTL